MTKTIHSPGQKALIEALTNARKEAGLSQMALAERLHCHQSMIARIESGERRIDVVELVVLARAIGVEAEAIMKVVSASVDEQQKL
ncbi:helix-turn-helix transcriptional regulator [Xinfangfangia sp. CPCC 101601]|uniref:Helix-turn-helix transcriptional regulator n=1 Tax=Pseudogemmobacter lacusdianii TaxID=3069608 RepID=A0ABU0VU19_9RHOB|nr:helix-turn-helix transcriptional regulator [Xinfangfangia sp. CPCC 101601]MDQ2065224.1 helix-turn-helix transcriptional regulator [Xinfangfangia sp. CPCC 101601]